MLDAADELQDKVLDDILALPGLVADVSLVLLTPDEDALLDTDCFDDVSIVGHDVDLLFHRVVDVPDADVQ